MEDMDRPTHSQSIAVAVRLDYLDTTRESVKSEDLIRLGGCLLAELSQTILQMKSK